MTTPKCGEKLKNNDRLIEELLTFELERKTRPSFSVFDCWFSIEGPFSGQSWEAKESVIDQTCVRRHETVTLEVRPDFGLYSNSRREYSSNSGRDI